ncbi:MAG: KpsF/GutQ family sugar-phosphate isomerase [Acidobacteria bacterium]|nr:KpsF/GutQ family sugar-phosphate isomerase [Acidobacteriota bacterium]
MSARDLSAVATAVDLARRVMRIEAEAVAAIADRLDERFDAAVDLLASGSGRVIVTGMGKSGIIARKLAATLSSTGTAAYFIHPAEAVHGDLGAIHPTDVVIALSQSGETPELIRLIEMIRRLDARLIALTGSVESALGEAADVALDCSVSAEACPLNLAPTASTTAALALGDALAMALLVRKGFREEDFAHLHPGGQLGKRLLRVDQLMHSGGEVPVVAPDASFDDVVETITDGGFGMTCVADADGRLAGIVTDGDLRRHLPTRRRSAPPPGEQRARDIMSAEPLTIDPSTLAVEALLLMERRRITSLPVVDAGRRVAGLIHLHDLWRTELF